MIDFGRERADSLFFLDRLNVQNDFLSHAARRTFTSVAASGTGSLEVHTPYRHIARAVGSYRVASIDGPHHLGSGKVA